MSINKARGLLYWLAKADNKSELIKYLLERHARGKSAHTAHTEEGGGEGGRADNFKG
jgi:hypothetical protein